MAKHPHLTLRHRTWFARLTIPKDVQHILGRKIFIASTRETEVKRANAVAAPWLADWQNRIDQARASATDPQKTEIERLTAAYRQYRNKELDAAGAHLVADVVDYLFERFGVSTEDQWRAVSQARGNVAQALQSLPDGQRAVATMDQITGRATPFLTHFEPWKAVTHLSGKTLDQASADIKQFAAAVAEPIETLRGKHVQQWIESQTVHAKTIRRKLGSLRGYWDYLRAHELVADDHKPFADRKVNNRSTAAQDADTARDRFTPADVVKLWSEAERKNDQPLAAAIRIAAYTGARREGICSLGIDAVKRDPDTGIEFIHVSEKTAAGVRDIPVHPALTQLLAELAKHPDDGYLIRSSSENKFGKRGDAIGKRFTRLKQELGFGPQHTFHSIRHTVAHLLEAAECPVGVAQDIVGHVKAGMTYGIYSGLTKLDQRAEWLAKAVNYPVDKT